MHLRLIYPQLARGVPANQIWNKCAERTSPKTGEIGQAQIFVAVLGASSYTYAEAVASQALPDWIGAHGRAFRFFGGCPEVLVPDNLKSGVTKVCRYEPDVHSTYAEMAAHYGVAVVPARVRKPKDKAKVEAGVLLVERWILARLLHRVYCSLTGLNRAIAELIEDLNRRPFKKLPGCRRSAFEEQDRPALKSLPAVPYEFAQWKQAKVNVLVLDDWGLDAGLNDRQRRDLLEILDDRYASRATVVTSQLPIEHWHEALGDPTLADAILDRLAHQAYRLTLKGESLRKKDRQNSPNENRS